MLPLLPLAMPWFTIAALAFLNRVRGGGYLPDFGSAKKLWGVAVLVALIASYFWPLYTALVIGLAYGIWDTLLPWGRWFTLNREPRRPGVSKFEKAIERISDLGNVRRDRLAFFLRNCLAFAVAGFVLAVATNAFALLLVVPLAALTQNVAYEIGWRLNPTAGVPASEHIFGACWGAAIAFGAHLLHPITWP